MLFSVIEWNKCISKQITRLYGVQNDGHNSCYGNSKNNLRIEKLEENLAQSDNVVADNDESLGETEIDDNTIDGASKEKIKKNCLEKSDLASI